MDEDELPRENRDSEHNTGTRRASRRKRKVSGPRNQTRVFDDKRGSIGGRSGKGCLIKIRPYHRENPYSRRDVGQDNKMLLKED